MAIELDVLGDSVALWEAWLADAARLLPVDPSTLPSDRAAAAVALDAAGAGNWRVLLARFAEDHAPVYIRPDAGTSAAIRRLASAGVTLGVFTDAPLELADVVLAHVGATRRVTRTQAGDRALDLLLESLGSGTTVVRSRKELDLSVS